MKGEALKKEVYTDEEINEIADWCNGLKIEQLFWLKDCYESFQEHLRLETLAETGSQYFH